MVAAFADVVAGTFNGFVTADGVTSTVEANGAVATTSMLFIIEAVALGMILKYGRLGGGPIPPLQSECWWRPWESVSASRFT